MQTKKIYIAGSLFKEADINQRILEENKIKALDPNVAIYNPITADINDKSKLPTANDIVWGDFKEIENANAILCALDDDDLGQACEIGMAFGLNYMREKLEKLVLENNVSINTIQTLLNEIPKKTIYAHLSDIRVPTADQYHKHYIPYGLNQFVVGAIEVYGYILNSSDQAIKKMLDEKK